MKVLWCFAATGRLKGEEGVAVAMLWKEAVRRAEQGDKVTPLGAELLMEAEVLIGLQAKGEVRATYNYVTRHRLRGSLTRRFADHSS